MKKCKGELCHRKISKTSTYNYNLFEQDDLIKNIRPNIIVILGNNLDL